MQGIARFVMDSIEVSETEDNVVIIGDLPPYERVDRVTASLNGEGLRILALLDRGVEASPQYLACTFSDFARLFRLRDAGVEESLETEVGGGLLRVLIPKDRI